MTQTTQRLRDRARKVKIRLKHAAPLLGVTRQHLSLVLNGHRESRRLVKEFTNLVVAAEKAGKTGRAA